MESIDELSNYDIVVGIPTFNEEDSVRYVVEMVDEGLNKYFSEYKSLILNVDSNSEDKTIEVVKATRTVNHKESYICPSAISGKGANILEMFNVVKDTGAKYFIMVDGDLKSINGEWIPKFLNPLINKEVDYITPIYSRNRYDGNITNHFCLPILFGLLGTTVNQPIAGDFAMSRDFILKILSLETPESIYKYGIDIFLTINALTGKFKHSEVYLGRKIHKPGLGKIVNTFKSVAETLLQMIPSIERNNVLSRKMIKLKRADRFINKPSSEKIEYLRKYAYDAIELLDDSVVEKYLGLRKVHIREVNMELWVTILNNMINYILRNNSKNLNYKEMVDIIAPFFFLRVLHYYVELDSMPSDIIIEKQSKLFREVRLLNEIKN